MENKVRQGNQGKYIRIKGLTTKERQYQYQRTRTLNKTEKVFFLLKVQNELFKNHMDAPERKSYATFMMMTVVEIEEKIVKYLNLIAKI